MAQKAFVRATKPALVVGLIVALVFIALGIVFFISLMKEDSGIGMIFVAFWILVVAILAGIMIHNLRTYSKNLESNVAEEIVLPESALDRPAPKANGDFDSKLRKLESLRKEGIISEDEYVKKRAEIMEQKW